MPKELETPAAPATEEEVKTPGQDETADDSATSEGESEQADQQKKRAGSGFQKRIAKLSTRAQQAEQEREQLRLERDFYRDQFKAKPVAPVANAEAEDPRPLRAEYANREIGDYIDDLAEWTSRKAAREGRAEALKEFETKVKATEEKSQQEKKTATWQEKLAAARGELPDFDEVMGEANIWISAHLGEALMDSELGAKVAYFLSQNPAEAVRINQLGPLATARAIGKIEAQIAKDSPAPDEEEEAEPDVKEPAVITPAVPLSKAPPPPTPIRKSSPSDKGLNDNLETDEWMRRRVADLKKR